MSEISKLNKCNKAELVQMVSDLEAKVASLQGELDAFRPQPGARKLSQDKADMIRTLHGQGVSKNALSLKYQVSRDSITAVLTNQIYKVQIATPPAKVDKVSPVAKSTKPAKSGKVDPVPQTTNSADLARKVASEARARRIEAEKARIEAESKPIKAKVVRKAKVVQPKEAEVVEIVSKA